MTAEHRVEQIGRPYRSRRSKASSQESERIGSNPNAGTELATREGKPMPWTAEDAERHTKKADSAKRQRMWAEIANSVLAETGDEGRAIREANAMVGKDHEKSAGSP